MGEKLMYKGREVVRIANDSHSMCGDCVANICGAICGMRIEHHLNDLYFALMMMILSMFLFIKKRRINYESR